MSERSRWAGALRAVVLAMVVLLLILALAAMARLHNGRTRPDPRKLARRGWTVYLMERCGFCTKQMAELRALGGFDRYVLCAAAPGHRVLGGYTAVPPLDPKAIAAFPMWYNVATGETRAGYQTPAALVRME